MAHAYDYSWAQIPAQSMASVDGCVGVMRYLSGGAGWRGSKDVSAEEIVNLHAAGLALGLVWETSGSREEEGYAAGQRDAQSANDEADWLGVPQDVVIYYADDNNDPDIGSEIEYMRGVASIGRRPWGEYGNGLVCRWALDNGGYAWVVETWRPDAAPDAHLTQLANTKRPFIPGIDPGQYDTNIIHRLFPMWGSSGTTHPNQPTPPIKQRRSVDKMWVAWLLYEGGNWVDVYYNGVLVDSFSNEGGTAASYGVGPKLNDLAQKCVVTGFIERAAYEDPHSGARARVLGTA